MLSAEQRSRRAAAIETTGDRRRPHPALDLAQLQGRAVQAALLRAGGNQTQAARLLGIGVNALRYRLKKQTSA